MSEYAHVELRQPPWLPAASCDQVVVLHEHDIPLTGLVRQGGDVVLYECIQGHTDPINLWRYLLIAPAESQGLRDVASADEGQELIDELASDRAAVLAVAVDGYGIVAKRDLPLGGDWDRTVNELFAELDARLRALGMSSAKQRQFAIAAGC